MQRQPRPVLVAALTVLALGACGGADPVASPRTPTEVGPAPRPASEPVSRSAPAAEPASPTASPSEPREMGSESASDTALELPREGLPGSLSAMAQQPAAAAAATNPALTTLSAAVERAELVDTLNGPGPFTIFAPTDDAFATVPAEDLDALLADPAALGDLITYHVHEGEALDRAALADRARLDTSGGAIVFGPADETLSLNGDQATIVLADVRVANGVVHLIDGLLSEEAE